jgi:CubicO group peptidase (beta-lactamase class C family)
MSESRTRPRMKTAVHPLPAVNDADLKATVAEIASRWPSAGLGVGVVRDGSLKWFLGHGVANVESREPITQDTVFRIGSITKTFTAIGIMQLWEQGLVDLDAPANGYLRSVRLIPRSASLGPATVRHLLTHTSGIGYWRRLSDLFQPGVGSGDRAGRSGARPLAEYYRKGLPVEIEPGTKWVYSNHGFAVLGQIVEDVTGQPLDRYLREHILEPLGMEHTDLIRSERVSPGLATGYVLRSRGLKPVADREVTTPGGGAMYSSTADMARYVAALLRGGANDRGGVLKPGTMAAMFEPQFQPDPRVPGMGLGFEPGEEGGHKTVIKTGIVSGFLSAMMLAPDDGIGVVIFSNTGGLDGRGAAAPVASAIVRRLLGLPSQAIRTDILPRPDFWRDLCGWYGPEPGPVTNLIVRALVGAGAEITVHDGHLMLKPLTPIPAIRRGMRLYPDDPDDPWVFRGEFPGYEMSLRLVFTSGSGSEETAQRLLIDLMSFRKRPDARNPRLLLNGMAAAGTVALVIRRGRRRQARG